MKASQRYRDAPQFGAPRMPAFGKRIVETKRAVLAPAKAAPMRAAPEISSMPTTSAPPTRVPYASLAILFVLSAVFWAELAYGVDPARGLTPSHRTIIALGGLSADLVHSGEWWRLFSAPLLHGSLVHIVSNAVALLIAGYYLEPLIGRRWFAAIYVIGSLGGAFGSLGLNAPDVVTVGASGAIMALFGATLVCSFADAAGEKMARRMRWVAIRLIIPSLIPLAATSGPQVDVSAHLGGAVAGGLTGLVLQVFWPEESERPAHAGLALLLTLFGAAASILSIVLVAQAYPTWAARGNDMIPDAMLPSKQADAIAQSAGLVDRYPHDPRGHFYRAIYFLDAHDLADAEEHLRIALSEKAALDSETTPEFQQVLRIVLAVTLVGEGHDEQAKILSPSDCAYAATREDMAKGLDLLRQVRICP